MSKKTKRLIFILAGITVLLVVFIAVSSRPGSSLHSVYKVIGTPFQYIQRGFSSFGRSIKNAFSVIGDYSEIKDRISELQEENDSLKNLENENEKLKEENAELRDLLELKGYFEDYNMVAANIISEDVTDWFNEFTIDRGTSDGLENGCVVITSKGLVGIVYNAGPASSKVRCIVDEQNVIMARISRNNALVRVRGMSNENYEHMLELDRIADETTLYVGDTIITAESGGVYPKGLVIGTVVQIEENAESGTRTAYIEPAVDFTAVSHVYVLMPSQEQAG
ncbi:MAG TPA: rod shape-determining protein MreC [Candidatus Egerieisoma faecipullorum]|uniref:Cell shape-determining protein MreC n=1 Tax=Candidatus Egerieisoma faecipullorum TaxID=2840963 RepID=A0A9D1LAP5_9CLOT|nr:rod shape-determining protein MreC [Candidatus Egerieisoma faecipullorum]